ncbi:alpha/beta hydrolase [Lichenihabitans psoromatis]|uniref:alpha/beta hydrolase n=1 Tax=Lichenihabitans psoromatis TaxID=2528642 RepID=UPI0010369A97|nr:alpha/beta hydrolase-fold protein [Lichenihabitans psoromatis]
MSITRVSKRLIDLALAVLVLGAVALPAIAGTLQPFHYHCAALSKDQTAQVYVPSGQRPATGWPVLFLLHGLNGAGSDWETLGNISATLDDLIAQKRIRPVLVVMPDAGNSWYVDSGAIGGPGDYATAIGRDLPRAVDAAWPVAKDRLHRAIAGVSMGGYGALRFALSDPDRYGAVAALSPAIWQNIPLPADEASAMNAGSAPPPPHDRAPAIAYFQKVDPATVTIGVDLPPDGAHFGGAFGTPFNPKRFNASNVFTLLNKAIDTGKLLPAIYLSVGDDDSHLLWRGSIAFFETMQMNRLDVDFRVMDGDHNWALWKKSIVDALIFVDGSFGKVSAR